MPASGTTGGDGPSPPGAPPGGISEPRRPGVPSRLTAVLLFTGTVLGGLLGAGIGWGLVDVGCRGDCTLPLVIGIVESMSGFFLPEGFKDIAAYVCLLYTSRCV